MPAPPPLTRPERRLCAALGVYAGYVLWGAWFWKDTLDLFWDVPGYVLRGMESALRGRSFEPYWEVFSAQVALCATAGVPVLLAQALGHLTARGLRVPLTVFWMAVWLHGTAGFGFAAWLLPQAYRWLSFYERCFWIATCVVGFALFLTAGRAWSRRHALDRAARVAEVA